MELIWTWLLSMFVHWQSWASGGGVGGFAFLVLCLLERYHPRGWTLARRWHAVLIGAFFVLGASFMTWKAQYERTAAANVRLTAIKSKLDALSQPKLSASIDHSMLATLTYGPHDEYSQKLITVFVTVKNTGAPSVATVGRAWLKLPTGKQLRPLNFMGTGKDLILRGAPGTPTVSVAASDSFLLRSSNGPIPRGGAIEGWLMYVVPGALDSTTITHSILKIEFSDVNGTWVSCSRELFLNKNPANANWPFNPKCCYL